MPASSITREDAVKMVANLEKNGRPVPAALRDAAAGETVGPDGVPVGQTPTGTPKNKTGKSGPPAKPTAGKTRPKPAPAPAALRPTPAPTPAPVTVAAPAGRRGPAGPTGSSGSSTRRSSSSSSKPRSGRSSVGRSFRSVVKSPSTLGGGDGGGLLLTLALYPLVLATFKYGTAGPGMWLRAKFLNSAPSTPADLAPGGTFGNVVPPALRQFVTQSPKPTTARATNIPRAN